MYNVCNHALYTLYIIQTSIYNNYYTIYTCTMYHVYNVRLPFRGSEGHGPSHTHRYVYSSLGVRNLAYPKYIYTGNLSRTKLKWCSFSVCPSPALSMYMYIHVYISTYPVKIHRLFWSCRILLVSSPQFWWRSTVHHRSPPPISNGSNRQHLETSSGRHCTRQCSSFGINVPGRMKKKMCFS